MAEDGIPEILAEQRLGHEVPGMRGLYVHASDRMRDDLKAASPRRVPGSGALSPTNGQQLINGMIAALGDHAICLELLYRGGRI